MEDENNVGVDKTNGHSYNMKKSKQNAKQTWSDSTVNWKKKYAMVILWNCFVGASAHANTYMYTPHNAGRYNSLSHRLKNSLRTHNRCISQSISIYSKKMNDDKLKLFGDPLSLDVLFLFIFVSFIIYFFFPHSFAFASIYIILSTRFLLTLCFLYRHILFVRNVFN